MAIFALRRRREELEEAPARETLAEVLNETLDDLRSEPDPQEGGDRRLREDGAHARRAWLPET